MGAHDDGYRIPEWRRNYNQCFGYRVTRRNGQKSPAEAAMAELNDPNRLLNEPDMEQAFTEVGKLDLDAGLTQAKKIQPKPVQLLARLQTIQGVIKQNASKPKPAPSPAKVAPPANSRKP